MQRTPTKLSSPGPYLAEITNHLDNSVMGGLEVILKTRIPASVTEKSNTYTVKYMTPFYGITSHRFLGNDKEKFNDTQKSYGMWMVPPDVGTTVMVIFVDSDPNQGYWIGCVPDLLENKMITGIAASEDFPAKVSKDVYETAYPSFKQAKYLPVAEFNKNSNGAPADFRSFVRPIHPFATVLARQGLLLDDIRGITSSSARREQPSMVFGISTPGPLDMAGPRNVVGYNSASGANNNLQKSSKTMPTSRLGGSTFVMDDGDLDGKNELIRLRTRTGHQVLMHNSQDLIYIGNSKGTAWMEFTSDGKIDIYAADSVSIHTKGDFNLKSDRDFNLHASRNFNIKADQNINLNAEVNLNSLGGTILTSTSGDHTTTVSGNQNLIVYGTSTYQVDSQLSIISSASIAIQSFMDPTSATSGISIFTNGSIYLDSDTIVQAPGSSAFGPIPIETDDIPIDIPDGIPLFRVPLTTPILVEPGPGEPNNQHLEWGMVTSMVRVPMNEPWSQHENLDRFAFNILSTDITLDNTSTVITSNNTINPESSSFIISSRFGIDAGMVGTRKAPWTTDVLFLKNIQTTADGLNFDPLDLLAVIMLETQRTFNPSIRNQNKDPSKRSSATGLIQFLESTAKELGTTTVLLSKMTRVEQLVYVVKYFRKWNWPALHQSRPTLGNIYLTILYPAARFKTPKEKVMDSTNPKQYRAYESNKVFDPKSLGYITVEMITKIVKIYKNDVVLTLKNSKIDPATLEPKE